MSEKTEIYVYTQEDMVMLKEKALQLLKHLPKDYKSALFIVCFLKKLMEEETGIKIKDIKIS